mgnify:CR=1 FL=1
MELSNAGSLDLKYIRDLYRISFPDVERKPFSLIERKAAMGTMEILMMSEGGERMGLAITASDGELVLLDYFAWIRLSAAREPAQRRCSCFWLCTMIDSSSLRSSDR